MEQKKTEFFNILPHKSIMSKIGKTGYSFSEALSELIDNSIDARAGKKVTINLNITPEYVEIKDNGNGMDKATVQNAIKLGYSSKTGMLGEFGLGLKTSANSLGKAFSITTKTKDCPEVYKICWDEDEWLKEGDWLKYPLIILPDTDKSFISGTIITITKLNTQFSEAAITKIIEELSVRFSPFIKNGELGLIINGVTCEEKTFSILPDTVTKINLQIGEMSVTGWWAYQLSGANKNLYGFNTFRRGRLITTYDKIGLTPNQSIKQIVGELNINGLPITHDKKGWIISSVEYQTLKTALLNYFKEFEHIPKRLLTGYPASKGKVAGTVRIMPQTAAGEQLEKMFDKLKPGDIFVSPMTRPQFLLAIRRSAAIVTDLGGALCHAAICAREFGIPAVVGTSHATEILKDGMKVIVDGTEGVVYEY